MKKKVLIIIIAVLVVIGGVELFILLGRKNTNVNVVSDHPVVIYFSATGTTKTVAEKIAEKAKGDIIEIIPKQKYTSAHLSYNDNSRANRELRDPNSRPEIENDIDVSSYDVIYLGYPIWFGTVPKIILTFIDTHDFTGKTIIPFCTSGSSPVTQSVEDLRKYDSKLTVLDGKRFAADSNDKAYESFVITNNSSNE